VGVKRAGQSFFIVGVKRAGQSFFVMGVRVGSASDPDQDHIYKYTRKNSQ